MTWSPSGRVLVVKLAMPLAFTATALVGPPATGWPFSVKVTVPSVTAADVFELTTLALSVTGVPMAGFADEVRAVVVGAPAADVIWMHQPPDREADVAVPPLSMMNRRQLPPAVAPANASSKSLAFTPPPGAAKL